MENIRPRMNKTTTVPNVFSETGIVAGDLNKTSTMKRLALKWIIRVVQHD